MDISASSAYAFSLHEFGFAHFNDERLTKRSVHIAATLLQHPQESIPQASGNWADAKATYRFFDNDKVQSSHMLDAHRQQIRIRAAKSPLLLVAQDTTALNLSGRAIKGVGSIGGGTSAGLFVHSSEVILPDGGIPIGIATQKIYARKEETKTKEYKKKAHTLPITDKESVRWIESIEALSSIFPDKQLVVIGDRESDITEVFQEAHKHKIDVLIRTKQNRLLEELDPTGKQKKLFDKAKEGDILTTYETDVPVDHHKTRKATLTIRTSHFILPETKTTQREQNKGIPLTILNVAEENPPEGTEPIHWMLTTTLTVTTAEEASEKVLWYIYRWRIERFHYTLKTGAFNIEELQFENKERFEKAITLYSILASRINYTHYYTKAYPNQDAEELFSKEEIRALCLKEGNRTFSMTVEEAVKALGKMGGHLGRKRDGIPGIKALWIGFQKLHYIVMGIQLEKQANEQR